jgi:dynactin complex subunit
VIRYGNDVELTDLARQITNLQVSMNAHLRDGRLHSVFLHAQTMHKKLDKLQERLNEIQLVP